MRLGYFLSCEEYAPADLLDQARQPASRAHRISGHYHPRLGAQGFARETLPSGQSLIESRRASPRIQSVPSRRI
jgi:hypothetical protein